jgi:hypothetical protein
MNPILAVAILVTAKPPEPYAGWNRIAAQDDRRRPVNIIIPPGFHTYFFGWEWLRPKPEDVRSTFGFRKGTESLRIQAKSTWKHNVRASPTANRNRTILDVRSCYIAESWDTHPTSVDAYVIPKDRSEDCFWIRWTGPGDPTEVRQTLRKMAIWYADHNHRKP